MPAASTGIIVCDDGNAALSSLAGRLARIASGANHHSSRGTQGKLPLILPSFSPPSIYYLRVSFVEPAIMPRCPLSPASLRESHSSSLQKFQVFLSSLTAVISPPFHRSPTAFPPLTHFPHTLVSTKVPDVRKN